MQSAKNPSQSHGSPLGSNNVFDDILEEHDLELLDELVLEKNYKFNKEEGSFTNIFTY